jgi:hypothetical protein
MAQVEQSLWNQIQVWDLQQPNSAMKEDSKRTPEPMVRCGRVGRRIRCPDLCHLYRVCKNVEVSG